MYSIGDNIQMQFVMRMVNSYPPFIAGARMRLVVSNTVPAMESSLLTVLVWGSARDASVKMARASFVRM